jgi:hypothetical protein
MHKMGDCLLRHCSCCSLETSIFVDLFISVGLPSYLTKDKILCGVTAHIGDGNDGSGCLRCMDVGEMPNLKNAPKLGDDTIVHNMHPNSRR